MANTRLRNDPIRIKKEMDIFSFPGKYQLDVPGQGTQMPYVEDPHLRLQYWGANRQSHIVDVEGDLKGYTKKISRDYLNTDEYQKFVPTQSEKNVYPNCDKNVTEDTRHVLPPFLFRGIGQDRFEEPFINPQSHIEIPFHNNLQTRIIEKDGFCWKKELLATNEKMRLDSSLWLPVNEK